MKITVNCSLHSTFVVNAAMMSVVPLMLMMSLMSYLANNCLLG